MQNQDTYLLLVKLRCFCVKCQEESYKSKYKTHSELSVLLSVHSSLSKTLVPCFYHAEADSLLRSFFRSNSPQKSHLSSPSPLRSGHSPGISWHEQTSDWTIPRPAHSSFCSASRRRGNTGEWASPLLPAVHESLTLPEYTEEGKKNRYIYIKRKEKIINDDVLYLRIGKHETCTDTYLKELALSKYILFNRQKEMKMKINFVHQGS